jgi:hypothetical protein
VNVQQHRVGTAWINAELKKLAESIEAQEREHFAHAFDELHEEMRNALDSADIKQRMGT